MARFKKKGSNDLPAMNSGSMSDIVFILLFFFMVISNMREATVLVRLTVPQASEIQKLEKKSLASNIYIGTPMETNKYGLGTRIQLNDQLSEVSDIAAFVESERAARNESDRPYITTTLKCDKDVRMGDVTDVKQELRKSGALRIMYSASRRVKDTY
ncbi:MAG: biopolymer transporter ExbD [Bacteroidales bacterium]|nr:biopolymer transporter ExbD [Bacteroidales bacterium]